MNKCIFCKISQGKVKSEKICENDNFFSIPNANPVEEGHTLIISKNHYKTILDIPSSLGSELLDCIKETALKLIKKYDSDGFNITNNNFEAAGQIVDHLHFHMLPRKKGDNKKGIYLG